MKKLITVFAAFIIMLNYAGQIYAQSSAPIVRGLNFDQLAANDESTFCNGSTGMCYVPNSIPTLQEWGLIIFSFLMIAIGCFFMLKYRRTQAFFFALMLTLGGGLILKSTDALAHALNIGNVAVVHSHRPGATEADFTAAEVITANAAFAAAYPAAIKTANATITYDCHGFTFDAARSWINDGDVPPILAATVLPANLVLVYNPVVGANAVGDIVIYKNGLAAIKHSGIVTAVTRAGVVTEVESKCGSFGKYKHGIGAADSPYGVNISYYR